MMLVLGGCNSNYDLLAAAESAGPAVPVAPVVASRGTPVPPPAAQILASGPSGARLDYRLPDGRPVAVVLGAPYQSGLQVPCRIGLQGGAGGPAAKPVAYVFCRQADQWYAMPPVVVSGL